MGRSEFCRSQGLSFSTLNRHLRKLRTQPKNRRRRIPSSGSRLIRVELAGPQPTRRPSVCSLTVVLSRGGRVEVQPDFDVPTLKQLLNVLECE
jgi:hypothetical protein